MSGIARRNHGCDADAKILERFVDEFIRVGMPPISSARHLESQSKTGA
jgi:hypothetical protein